MTTLVDKKIKIDNTRERDPSIDILRVFAIFLVILAHSGMDSNNLLFHIRTFDVILLFFISGISFSYSQKNNNTFGMFIKRRFLRLIIPAWVISIIYIVLIFFRDAIFYANYSFDFILLLKSIIFYDGIGYVWVLYYLFVSSIIGFLYNKYLSNILGNIRILFLIVASIGLQFISLIALTNELNILIEIFISPIIYSIIFILGILFNKFNKKERFFLILVALGVFVYYVIKRGFIPNNFKYPPQPFYISYGILISTILYMLVSRFKTHFKNIKQVLFLSKNSLNIYMIHIIFVQIYFTIFNKIYPDIYNNYIWMFHFIINLITPVIILKIYYKIKRGD